jgi:hypothetical protein
MKSYDLHCGNLTKKNHPDITLFIKKKHIQTKTKKLSWEDDFAFDRHSSLPKYNMAACRQEGRQAGSRGNDGQGY